MQDLYNAQTRQKLTNSSNAKAALDFLDEMRSKDEMMFWRHTIDGDGRLEHLFWCNGAYCRDFSVFGNVLAVDATYRKNSYMCPFVVFSGLNHHNQSIVFVVAVVGNETEETYMWLFDQFVLAMGTGKTTVSIITDGDVPMPNAIRQVLPSAHHRLCAWHLLQNATSNVKNPKFVSRLKQCILEDYDLGKFKRRWLKLVQFLVWKRATGLQNFMKGMWATAYVCDNFFEGFLTTSRCEGLQFEFWKLRYPFS